MKYFQQGDILFKEATFKLKGLKEVKSRIIKLGSASGHAHVLKGGKLLMDSKDNMFILADDKTYADHDEHKPIKLQKGKYSVSVVLEYDHWLEESKEVID